MFKEGTYFDAIKVSTEHFSYAMINLPTLDKEGISIVVNEDIRESLYYKIWGIDTV